ncbi:MAG: methionyl-tRNA formyltransferase [Chromatiales bacterium]|nr:methionyl-tRNA formyltransferase [Chromatiales bacterium]
MSAPGRILFAGSPEFALPTLEALLASRHQVVAVLTQPDRPAGRGRRVQPGPVKRHALDAELPVLQPDTLRDPGIVARLADFRPDLMVVVAYGLLLPTQVLALPRTGCVNVHASLLPRWRGASPVQAALLAGDEDTGVSIMALDEGLDTGPVYLQRRLAIEPGETAGQLARRLARLGADTLVDCLDEILDGRLQPVPQPATGATHAGRIRKTDAVIDWQLSAREIDGRIRAWNPWPVAETLLDGMRLRCWSAQPVAAEGAAVAPPGTVLAAGDEGIDVQTGDGVLRLLALQLPGRPALAAADFVRGRPLVGKRLGPSD